MFQSTRPRGARRLCCKRLYPSTFVSIHAPAWGATPNEKSSRWDTEFQSTRPRGARHERDGAMYITREFQSTRPRGARRLSAAKNGLWIWFQSTRPRGARRDLAAIEQRLSGFNPRARVGRDILEF